MPGSKFQPEVHVRWGESGSGKTRYVYDTYGVQNVFCLNPRGPRWCDGYDGEGVLLIDDYDGRQPSLRYVLMLADGRPTPLKSMGRFVRKHYRKIYITSHASPRCWRVARSKQHLHTEFLKQITSETRVTTKDAGS